MTIGEHVEEFAGRPVEDFQAGQTIDSSKAYRLSLDYEEADAGAKFEDLLGSFLASEGADQVVALLIGAWGEMWEQEEGSDAIVEALVAARERLPNLRALFLGDITYDECEISWINQGDVSPLWEAFPELEEFWVRGSNNLSLGRPLHAKLKKLVIQCGGMPGALAREAAAAELPALEHLELWLGEPNYGNDTTADDLQPILSGDRFPQLKYLGLRDASNADDMAKVVAAAPILERIETLDLSMGALGDEGAQSLIDSPAARKLKVIDITHHYVSEEMVAKLKELGPKIEADDPQEPDDWGDGELHRYVAVGE